ncbi:hypothetical protein CSHISOI_11352 [Colletotrichum shisoi]|uniref:Uncharacterized protein n=1 Tax=Colletotrichum shisoi TaxID=2078593 RepID=A0A5Q4BB69_9PEZI|nr:hypothetical protein CSHISOI_11352 [Colletotrichum shisoi]
MCKVTKFAFLFLAVLGLCALIAAWAINMSLGGLHALHVWACDNILPSSGLFFSDWCSSTATNNINPAPHPPPPPPPRGRSRPLPAGTMTRIPSSSAWNQLTPAKSSLLQKPDRHFCVFDFGDLLGGMADEEQTYMTDRQREAFAAMRKASSIVGQLQETGRRQARIVERAQDKIIGLVAVVDDAAALLPTHYLPHPPPPPTPPPLLAWLSPSWLWSLFAETDPTLPPPPPPPTPPPVSLSLEGPI